MKQKEINENLKHLGQQVKGIREKKGHSIYYSSMLCEMGSYTGLRRLEQGDEIRLSTLLKASKNLNINFEIKNGRVEVVK